MNYRAIWKLMTNLISELKKSGEIVPLDVIEDLRSAKTIIEVLKFNHSQPENLLKIEKYLRKVESYLFFTAESKFGKQYVDKFMKDMVKAQKNEKCREIKQPSLHLFRRKPSLRIKSSKEIPIQKVKQLAEESRLSHIIQEDGYLLVYGDRDKIERFVKKLAKG